MNVLEVNEATRTFGAVAAVDHVSLTVAAGEAVGLIGANGAGKTTLFKLICGELALTTGEILFEGRRLSARADARSRAGIARTFQIVELFGGLSVMDHVLVALQAHEGRQGPLRDLLRGGETLPAERRRCEEAIAICGLEEVAEAPATTLSLGQRRAVELARALVAAPRLLLADEPSSGLDVDESRELIAVIQRVRHEHNMSVVLIDHDLATIEAVADRVVAMDAGRVIANGSFKDVINTPEVVSSWLGTPR